MRLPRSTDDLRGLRAARWVRESTAGQTDRYGPEAQREQQDRSIERHGLVDTGTTWSVAHSGRTIARTSQWADMLAAAGVTFDVLLVGYVGILTRCRIHDTSGVLRRRAEVATMSRDGNLLGSGAVSGGRRRHDGLAALSPGHATTRRRVRGPC